MSSIFFSNCSRAAIFDWKRDSKVRSVIEDPREYQTGGGENSYRKERLCKMFNSWLLLRSRVVEDPALTFETVYLETLATKLPNLHICNGENPVWRFPETSIVEIPRVVV